MAALHTFSLSSSEEKSITSSLSYQSNPPQLSSTLHRNNRQHNYYSQIRFDRQKHNFVQDLRDRQSYQQRCVRFPAHMKDYMAFLDKYQLMQDEKKKLILLGSGVHCKVYKVCLQSDTTKTFAAKRISYRNDTEKKCIMKEHKLLHRFGNGLYIMDIFENRDNKFLVFIMCIGVDLNKWWNTVKKRFKNECFQKQEWILKKIFYEILLNLAAIHDAQYIHHDIKPLNILVINNGRYDNEWINNYSFHIIDYGLAMKADDDYIELEENEIFFGTFGYCAWELMTINEFRRYSYSVDLYALAITICELIIGYNVLKDDMFIKKQEDYCCTQLVHTFHHKENDHDDFEGFDNHELYEHTVRLKCEHWTNHFGRKNGISSYNGEESSIRSTVIHALQHQTAYTTRFKNFISNLIRDNKQQRIATVYDAINHDFFYDI